MCRNPNPGAISFFTSILLVGQIGILNETVTVDESVGSVRILVGFISPAQVSADIAVSISFSTGDNSAMGESHVSVAVARELILSISLTLFLSPSSHPHHSPSAYPSLSHTPSTYFQLAWTTLTLQRCLYSREKMI